MYLCGSSTQFSYLIVTTNASSTDHVTYVFTIDTESGAVFWSGLPNVDLFGSYSDAINSVSRTIPGCHVIHLGKALIGTVVQANELVICCITTDEQVALVLGHPIYRIESVRYKIIPLKGRSGDPDHFWADFPIVKNHYYCNSLDLTGIFPYSPQSSDPTTFSWNLRWQYAFRHALAPSACVVLLQGTARTAQFDRFSITYILKRSSRHCGTRYHARGLNATVSAANECECELIFCRGDEQWAHGWRRGSSPVRWHSRVNYPWSAARHSIDDQPGYETPMYFQELQNRFSVRRVHIVCLLEESEQSNELELLQTYRAAAEEANLVLPSLDIDFQEFDINKHWGTNSSCETMSVFLGTILSEFEGQNSLFTARSAGQSILFRFNCADSLDRTNTATFYYAVLLVAKFGFDHNLFEGDCMSLERFCQRT